MEQSMKPAWFHILVAIAAGHRHGYAIRQDVERRSEGRVRLWPATLYGALSDLVRGGLLAEEDGGSADPAGDPRRRCYMLTAEGRLALEAELRQLEALVRAARVSVSGAGE